MYSTHAVEDLSNSSEECQLKDLNYVFAVDITSPALGKILLRTLAVIPSASYQTSKPHIRGDVSTICAHVYRLDCRNISNHRNIITVK